MAAPEHSTSFSAGGEGESAVGAAAEPVPVDGSASATRLATASSSPVMRHAGRSPASSVTARFDHRAVPFSVVIGSGSQKGSGIIQRHRLFQFLRADRSYRRGRPRRSGRHRGWRTSARPHPWRQPPVVSGALRGRRRLSGRFSRGCGPGYPAGVTPAVYSRRGRSDGQRRGGDTLAKHLHVPLPAVASVTNRPEAFVSKNEAGGLAPLDCAPSRPSGAVVTAFFALSRRRSGLSRRLRPCAAW